MKTVGLDLVKMAYREVEIKGVVVASWHYEFGSNQKIYCLSTNRDGKEIRLYECDNFLEWRGVSNGVMDTLKDFGKDV